MQQLVIKGVNCALLVIVLIGLPAVASARLWHLQLSSIPMAQWLMFWGLGIAAVGNIFAAFFLTLGRKSKIHCWEWAAVFGGLWLAFYGYTCGYFNFLWLKHTLLWLQKHL
jgi:hypothetical protein